ncbi:MAG: hypothetical protein AAGM22_05615 [Acidobacteriota bacterium]
MLFLIEFEIRFYGVQEQQPLGIVDFGVEDRFHTSILSLISRKVIAPGAGGERRTEGRRRDEVIKGRPREADGAVGELVDHKVSEGIPVGPRADSSGTTAQEEHDRNHRPVILDFEMREISEETPIHRHPKVAFHFSVHNDQRRAPVAGRNFRHQVHQDMDPIFVVGERFLLQKSDLAGLKRRRNLGQRGLKKFGKESSQELLPQGIVFGHSSSGYGRTGPVHRIKK